MTETYRRQQQFRQSADWMVDSDGRPLGLVGPGGELYTLPADTHSRRMTAGRLPTWRRALGRAMAGGRARILVLGDSTVVGAGAGTGGNTALDNARRASFPSALARAMSRLGVLAHNESLVGTQNMAGAGVAYDSFDPRVSPGPFVLQNSANFLTAGGHLFRSAAGTLSFTPEVDCDRFEVLYVRNGLAGSFDLAIDGGAPSSFSLAPGTSMQTAEIVAGSVGRHTLTITASNGNLYFAAIVVSNSEAGGVEVLQAGSWGDVSANFLLTTNVWSPANIYDDLAPDLALIQLTINDINGGTSLKQHLANLADLADTLGGLGADVVLMTGLQSNPSAYPRHGNGHSAAVYAAIAELAEARGLPLLDLAGRLGPYARADAELGMTDSAHGSAALYGDVGLWVARTLLSIG